MQTVSTSTIVALFESRSAAERAAGALISAGFDQDRISVIAHNPNAPGDTPDIGPQKGIGSGTDAGTGATIGTFAGFIGGIVALAIPGIGPILAVGPLAAGIMGAGLGAATGGIIGALKDTGIPETDATRLSDAIRRGRVMLSAYVPTDRADDAATILDDNGALDVDEPVDGVNPDAPETTFRPLTPEALEAVRLKPGEGLMDRQRERERKSQVYPGFTGMGPASNT